MATNKISILKALLMGLLLLLPLSARAQTTPLSDLDALRYIASQPDLIAAFGADAAKGRSHYETWGIKEGRKITFEPLNYTASHPDLMAAFGIDEIKAATHYIQWGFKEGRKTTFNPLNYIASHPDLISAFGADAAKGARHYIQWGYAEKRQITFDPARYMASHPDLIQAFAGDETKAATHYIQWGYKEKRQTTFTDLDALQYVASFADLIQSIGSDVVTAIRHYVTTGYNAGRRISFDALAYIASYGDLIAAFGTDALAGVKHYLNWGYKEGRQVIFDALGYLSRHTDLQQAFGSDTVAATKHYINWGFKEGRTYALTVSVKVTGPGSASQSRIFVNSGDRARVNLVPSEGGYLASISGCNGSLTGDTFTTSTITRGCEITAVFRPSVGDITGRVASFNPALPGYVTVVSSADDSVLVSRPVDASGAFKITGLDDRKDYYLEFEQPGTAPTGAVVDYGSNRRVTKNDDSFVERLLDAVGIRFSDKVSPSSVAVQVGDNVTFDTAKVKGLSEGEFVYRWEGNETASGSEYSSYINNPLKVEVLGNETSLADPQAATTLAEAYGIVLVNPDSNSDSDQLVWTSEYAERLLKMVQVTPLPVSSQGSRGWSSPTRVLLFNREIPADVEKTTPSYIGGTVKISASAFVYAAPLIARIEGRRGFFFSNRLFRAVVRMATEDGARINLVREMMKQRYGITIASDQGNPLLINPSATCPRYPSDCTQGEWRLFKPDELFDLLAISEEFPEGLRDFSQTGREVGLRHVLRRRDGVPHPLYPQAGAVAWPDLGYAEYMEKGLIGTQKTRHALYVHEKAHFLWAGLLSERLRLDWMRLSGWYRVPTLIPGQDVKAIGKCDDWQRDPKAWNPPNVTAEDSAFKGPVKHDAAYSDAASVKEYWGSCSTTQFVSTYAAQTNPNEDFAESVSTFLLNPDLLRSRALPKYEFIRDRLMQGGFYISKIREDLQFEVFNLYPDYTYPGKIKTLDVKVVGNASEDKLVTIRISLHTSAGCSSAKNSGCFEGASQADLRLYSRLSPPTFIDARLMPVTPSGDVLEGTVRIPKYAAAGWWQVDSISIRDDVGNERLSKQASRDFGWKLYVQNSLEDLTKPKIIANSVSMKLLPPGDQELAGLSGEKYQISGDERILRVSYRVDDRNMVDGKRDCFAAISYADSLPQAAGVRIYKNSSEEYGEYRGFSTVQTDGATGVCHIDQRVTKFWTNGTYYVPYVFVYDAALNRGEKRLSLRGVDPTIERAPEITVQSSASDDVPPVLDIGVCKSADVTERCLRVAAAPTNPSIPNGETVVSVYYWAFEDSPLAKSSGLNEGYLQLRDPTGKIFGYYLMEGAVGSVGVVGRSPKRWRDGAYSFSCPSNSSTECNATTPVQYQARIVLPAGSAPGTWGVLNFAVGDKTENYRGYDFTETFRFIPFISGDGPVDSALGDGAIGTPFTFKVAGPDSELPSTSTVVVNAALDSRSTIVSASTNWVTNAASRVTDGVSQVARWVQGGVRSGVNLFRHDLSFYSNGAVSAAYKAETLSSAKSTTQERNVLSVANDPLTGSRYQIVREAKVNSALQQGWILEYRSSTDTLFTSKTFPDTAEVSWRRFGRIGEQLATTGWARVCSDRVWAVQDGYQLLFHVGDRALTDLRPGQLFVNSTAEATVITDVRCAFGGAVWVEGYAFGVSEKEPLLRTSSVPATRFGFALDRYGAVTKREVSSAPFDIVGLCSAPANEQQMFCSEAKKAVGW